MTDERMQRFSDIIIDHSQFPRHHGSIDNPTHEGHGENPFCGDRLKLQFSVNADGVIENAAIESVGCAISTASASLLATSLHGLRLDEADALFERIRTAIISGLDEDSDKELGELAALTMAARYPSRVKCVTLAWHVLKHALAEDKSSASTESISYD